MQNRIRLLKGATALLYVGPLLAGLGGFGWAILPIFVAIFLLWLFVLRPQQWPRTLADWSRPEALISLLTQGVVQVLLVAISFGIGRGIGGALGALPPFPALLPVAISFLSIPLARMIWDPWAAEGLNEALDDAIARLNRPQSGGEDTPDLQGQIAIARRMLTELNRLPPETPMAELSAHLAAMGAHARPEALRVALMDPIYDGTAPALGRRAAILHATDPATARALTGTSYALALFRELKDPESLQLFASRCSALLAAEPGLTADCPDPADVEATARRIPRAAAALTALAAGLRSVALDGVGQGKVG